MLRFQKGDADAFSTLHARHNPLLIERIAAKTSNREVASDICQDVWLTVHKHRDSWDPARGRFRTWLTTIVRNTVVSHWRRKSQRPFDLEQQDLLDGLTSHGVSETWIDITRAIDTLPTHLRESFILGPCMGMDHSELAGELGISPDNARARVSRARSALRTLLAPDAGSRATSRGECIVKVK